MSVQVFSVFAGAFVLCARASASSTYLPLSGDEVDSNGLYLLQTRAGMVSSSKHGFFFWSQPETTQAPVVLADTGQGDVAVAASAAATVRVAASPVEKKAKGKASLESLEGELKDFISNVKSPEFISHEAVQHVGEDCWESCGKKGGLCAWCGDGNSCCRSGWDKNPTECIGVTVYKTKKHECVGPAVRADDVALSSSSSSTLPVASVNATAVAQANATVAANETAGFGANATAIAAGATSMKGTVNSTQKHGHKHNHSSQANHTIHYHKGDAQHDWRPLPVGGTNAPLTSWGFSVVAGLRSAPEMSRFIRRVIEIVHCRVVNEDGFHAFFAEYFNSKGEKYDDLVKELNALCDEKSAKADASWLEREGHDEAPQAAEKEQVLESNATETDASDAAE